MQGILDSLPAHVALLDDQGVILAVNETWRRFARDSGNESCRGVDVGVNYLEACSRAINQGDPDALAAIEGLRAVLERRADRFTCEYPCHAPRQQRWFLLQATHSTLAGGTIVAHTDITAGKLALEALRDSEQMLNQAAATAGFGIFQHDHRTDDFYCSPELYRIMALEPSTPITMARLGAATHPDDLDEVMRAIHAAHDPAGDGVHCKEHRIVWPDGKVRWVLVRSQTSFEGSGEARRRVRTIGAVVDITQRREAEEALRRLNEDLEARVRERTAELEKRAHQLAALTSELTLAEERERRRLADVLHDHIQQMLVGARMSLELAQRREGASHVDAIRQAQQLIIDSIQACRSLTVELSPPVLHDSGLPAGLEWLQRSMKKTHGLNVSLDLDADADPGRDDLRVLMFQATRELLFNVVKHAGVKKAVVELRRAAADELQLVVSDLGSGFDPNQLEHRPESAVGFGLLSIRERLALMGGRVRVQAAPGQGSRFELTLPVTTAAPVKPATTRR